MLHNQLDKDQGVRQNLACHYQELSLTFLNATDLVSKSMSLKNILQTHYDNSVLHDVLFSDVCMVAW